MDVETSLHYETSVAALALVFVAMLVVAAAFAVTVARRNPRRLFTPMMACVVLFVAALAVAATSPTSSITGERVGLTDTKIATGYDHTVTGTIDQAAAVSDVVALRLDGSPATFEVTGADTSQMQPGDAVVLVCENTDVADPTIEAATIGGCTITGEG